MPIQERISQVEDMALYEICRNPVIFAEFIENFDKKSNEEPFKLHSYQKEMLSDFNSYVSIVAGRAAGKTRTLVSLIYWLLVYNVFPADYIVYLIPNKVHLEPVWSGLIRSFRTNTFLKHFISPNAGINSSDFKITLLNQAVLMARIAGQTGTGVSVIGLHTPMFFVDESGYEPWGSWIELQPSLNTFTPGFKLMVAGVPDGRRDHSVCFVCDQEDSNYSKFRIPSDRNPLLTSTDRQHALEQYGGEDSDDFIHLWKAQHGRPVFALFDRSQMEVQSYPVYNLLLSGQNMGSNLNEYISRISTLPGLNNKSSKCIMGIDLGYTEPTAIWILHTDEYGRIKFHGKIRMEKVSYPIQERIIDMLDSKFEPTIIGIDKGAGGQGISLIQHLTDDKEYLHKNYSKKITPVDFSSNISMGYDSNGEELKSKTKPFATTVLQDYSNNHKIIFSSTDLEMVTELERMTYTKNPSGEIIYRTLTPKGGKKGEDHFTSALLCATLAYYMANDYFLSKPEKKKLFAPMWIGGN
jgi:hypothetical protein